MDDTKPEDFRKRINMILKGYCSYCVTKFIKWEKNKTSKKPEVRKGKIMSSIVKYRICQECFDFFCKEKTTEHTEKEL